VGEGAFFWCVGVCGMEDSFHLDVGSNVHWLG